MKKLFLSAIVLISVTVTQAQSPVKFGVKAGANFSTWTGQQATGSKLLPGFHAGGTALIPLSSTVGIKPELLFSTEGIKLGPTKYVLGFVRIPLLVEYRHASGFRMETGPQIGYLVSAKYKSDVESMDVKEQLPPLETSWGVGFGYMLPAGVGISIRYNFGISELGNKENSLKTAAISAGITYQFGGR